MHKCNGPGQQGSKEFSYKWSSNPKLDFWYTTQPNKIFKKLKAMISPWPTTIVLEAHKGWVSL